MQLCRKDKTRKEKGTRKITRTGIENYFTSIIHKLLQHLQCGNCGTDVVTDVKFAEKQSFFLCKK